MLRRRSAQESGGDRAQRSVRFNSDTFPHKIKTGNGSDALRLLAGGLFVLELYNRALGVLRPLTPADVLQDGHHGESA